MAFALNKVMLIGNLGRDCENRFSTDNSFSITTFSLATTRSYKNKEGNWTDETTWHNIVCYNLNDYTKENLKKGKKVYIEGRISMRQYNDKDGNKRTSFEIVAENIILLDPRGSNSSSNSTENSGGGMEERYLDISSNSSDKPEDDLPF
ncbi:MAG: single-stranded DNA-binding protein [Ignavibacteria bacterium]|nr:single-stranded DNA-binding protein [Ignavibacteria bacterium]